MTCQESFRTIPDVKEQQASLARIIPHRKKLAEVSRRGRGCKVPSGMRINGATQVVNAVHALYMMICRAV